MWYGVQPAWWAPLERDARLLFGSGLRHQYRPGALTYYLDGLDVIGEPHPVAVSIRFFEAPPYATYGQDPADFPRVHAMRGLASKHRYPDDDALCLWFPGDPVANRWTSSKGLLDLIEVVRTHLFLEHYWRITGGDHGGHWLVDDKPHGFPGGSVWRGSLRRTPRAGRGRRPQR